MNQLTKRQQTYSRISSALACLSNKQLQQMLAEGKVMHTVLTSYLGKDDWSVNLAKFTNDELGTQIPTKVKE